VKKISCNTFLCSHKIHKIEKIFSFEVQKKKILANFLRIIELFTQKNPIPDPGSRGKKGTGSRIRIRNTDTVVVREMDGYKLVARLLSTAALWVRIQTSLKNTNWAT
jgi:hypothetical protein